MKQLLAILISFFLMSAAFADVDCGKNEKMVALTAKTLALTLNCRSEVAVRYDVNRMSTKLGLCKAEEDKGLVCLVAAKAGVYMVQKQIPVQWLCKPDVAMKVLEMTLNKTCESITGL